MIQGTVFQNNNNRDKNSRYNVNNQQNLNNKSE